jgi:hypothetical protein
MPIRLLSAICRETMPRQVRGAFLPIVHVVLLEDAGRAEAAYPDEPHHVVDLGRGGRISEYPRSDLGHVRPPRLPTRKVREVLRRIERCGNTAPIIGLISRLGGPSRFSTLGPDWALIFLDHRHRRVAHIIGTDTDEGMAVTGEIMLPLVCGLAVTPLLKPVVTADR